MKKAEVDNKIDKMIAEIEAAIPEDESIKINEFEEVAKVFMNNGFSESDYRYWGKYISEKAPKWMKNYLNDSTRVILNFK